MTIRKLAWMLLLAASCTDVALDDDVNEADQLGTLPPPPFPPPSYLQCRAPLFTVSHNSSSINATETWAGNTVHVVPTDVTINATVVIAPCARLQIAGGKMITIGPAGMITTQVDANGNGSLITRNDASAWGQIRVVGGSLELRNTWVEAGGGSVTNLDHGMIVMQPSTSATGRLLLQNSTLAGSASYGLNALGGSIDGQSTGLTISGSSWEPMAVVADLVGSVPSGTYTGNTLDEIVIPAAKSKVVSHSARWRNRGVPYRIGDGVAGHVDVAAPSGVATLRIDPGVTIRFQHGTSLRIDPGVTSNPASGALIAVGTQTQPIQFTSAYTPPAPGDWNGIWFGGQVDPTSVIQFAGVGYAGGAELSGSQSNGCAYAGTSSSNWAAIRIMGPLPPKQIDPMNPISFVRNTIIAYSANHGIDRGWQDQAQPNTNPPVAFPEIDMLTPNTFGGNTLCETTHPKNIYGGCPSTPTCN